MMFIKNNKSPLIITKDDELAIRRSVKYYLEDFDFEVPEAENGALGIELCSRRQPDLTLLDLSMSETDGFVVLRHLTKASPQTPVIAVSSIDIVRDAVKALRFGALDYLLKPLKSVKKL